MEWKSKNKWTDVEPNTGKTYIELWHSKTIRSMARKNYNKPMDCANYVLYQLAEFAHTYELPYHLEGDKTGDLRVFDNDLMLYDKWQGLAHAAGAAYAATDFFNVTNFLMDGGDTPDIGEILAWDFAFNTDFHTQIITDVYRSPWFNGNGDIEVFQGSTGAVITSKRYAYKWTQLTWSHGSKYLFAPPAKRKYLRFDFEWMDKFHSYNSMAERDNKYTQIRERLIVEWGDFYQRTVDSQWMLSHDVRVAIKKATDYELNTGKPYYGHYSRGTMTEEDDWYRTDRGWYRNGQKLSEEQILRGP